MKKLVNVVKDKKADFILLSGLFGLGVIFLFIFLVGKNTSSQSVVVQVDGEVVNSFSIEDNISYTIEGKQGSNELRIENKKVYLIHADCPDKLCVNTGKIQYVGQSIICLPNRVVVEIK